MILVLQKEAFPHPKYKYVNPLEEQNEMLKSQLAKAKENISLLEKKVKNQQLMIDDFEIRFDKLEISQNEYEEKLNNYKRNEESNQLKICQLNKTIEEIEIKHQKFIMESDKILKRKSSNDLVEEFNELKKQNEAIIKSHNIFPKSKDSFAPNNLLLKINNSTQTNEFNKKHDFSSKKSNRKLLSFTNCLLSLKSSRVLQDSNEKKIQNTDYITSPYINHSIENELESTKAILEKEKLDNLQNQKIKLSLEEQIKKCEKKIIELTDENIELKKRREYAKKEFLNLKNNGSNSSAYYISTSIENLNLVTLGHGEDTVAVSPISAKEKTQHSNVNRLLSQLKEIYKGLMNLISLINLEEGKKQFIIIENQMNTLISQMQEFSDYSCSYSLKNHEEIHNRIKTNKHSEAREKKQFSSKNLE